MAMLFQAGQQFFNSNGQPLAAGSLTFYVTETTTDKAIYSDAEMTVEAANPYTLDASGRIAVNLYGAGDYTVIAKTGASVTVWSRDDVFGWNEYPTLDPRRYGVVGDDTTDDTAALNAWGAAIAADGGIGYGVPGFICLTTGTVTIPYGAAYGGVDFNGMQIHYDGAGAEDALVIGHETTTWSKAVARNINVYRTNADVDWTDTASVGVRLNRFSRSHNVSVVYVSGFRKGVICYSKGGQWAYNTMTVGDILDNKYGLVLETASNAADGGFVNENLFIGGRYGCSSNSIARGAGAGVLITWDHVDSYRGQNNNVWLKPCFETAGESTSPAADRYPMHFDGAGGYCRVIHPRHEGNGGPFAYMDTGTPYASSAAARNVFELGYDEGEDKTLTLVGNPIGNVIISADPRNGIKPIWHSGFIPDLVTSNGAANGAYIGGDLHFTNAGTASKSLSVSNVDRAIDYLYISSSTYGVGFYVDTRVDKQFRFALGAVDDKVGRMAVQCWDVDGVLLTDSDPDEPYAWGFGEAYGAVAGGAWATQSDAYDKGMIHLHADVAKIRIVFTGGTNPLRIQTITLEAIGVDAGAPVVYSGVNDWPNQMLAAAKPDTSGTTGYYAKGATVFNSAAAAAAPSHWTCTTAGWLAKAWAISTAYVVGQIRENDTGKIYVCRTAGTSAGSGGPTGTSTAIADGTCTWDYIGVKAVFATSPNLA